MSINTYVQRITSDLNFQPCDYKTGALTTWAILSTLQKDSIGCSRTAKIVARYIVPDLCIVSNLKQTSRAMLFKLVA